MECYVVYNFDVFVSNIEKVDEFYDYFAISWLGFCNFLILFFEIVYCLPSAREEVFVVEPTKNIFNARVL